MELRPALERALDLSWVGQIADQKHRLADSQMASLPPFYHFLVLIVLVTWILSFSPLTGSVNPDSGLLPCPSLPLRLWSG